MNPLQPSLLWVLPLLSLLTRCRGLDSRTGSRSRQLPSVKPVRRVIGKRVWNDGTRRRVVEDYVIDIPFKESLETAMQYNPELLRNAMDAPRHWMEAKQKMGATPISDFFHRQAFWNHPELGKPYKEGDALRLPLMFSLQDHASQ